MSSTVLKNVLENGFAAIATLDDGWYGKVSVCSCFSCVMFMFPHVWVGHLFLDERGLR